ncbi:hypothetical protein HYS01_02760 [Candidatus Saccharibacteria bacterium]|nr:hypothetical protein [Candidatus Saccharibacteria bacterium]
MYLGLKAAYKPSISVKEARKILGKDSVGLSDNQMIEIIDTLTLMAKQYLQRSSSKKELGV